jgi:ESS family glutamate:Na+ symporter
MNFPWSLIINIGIISAALLIATFIRTRIRFVQRFLIPNALVAGFILLILYNFVLPKYGLTNEGFGMLVYHLLNISFIAMTLRKGNGKVRKSRGTIFATSVSVLSQYALQAFLGLLVTFLLIKTIFPDLFPAFGFLLPLGFVLGPGQAFAIGSGWEPMGFTGAGTVGLTFAAIGFLWACFGGVFLINYAIQRGWLNKEQIELLNSRRIRSGLMKKGVERPIGSFMSTETEAIDPFTYHIALVMVVYLISYFLLKGLGLLLAFAGPLGVDLATNLWGINFVFSAIVALGFKAFAKGAKFEYTFDNGTLTRISGFSVDLMVTAAIGAISLVVVGKYIVPILILSTIGGVLALISVPWFCSRIFTDHRFQRMLVIFGVSTGTMPTGLALLRVIDPDFETPVARDYMFSSGLTFVFAIPFIMIINLPAYSATHGNPILFWLAVAVAFAYLLFVLVSYFLISKRRGIRKPKEIWLRGQDMETDSDIA